MYVQQRNGDNCTCVQMIEHALLDRTSNDFHPVDLVAMNSSQRHHTRANPWSTVNMGFDGDDVARGDATYWDFDDHILPRLNQRIVDLDWFALGGFSTRITCIHSFRVWDFVFQFVFKSKFLGSTEMRNSTKVKYASQITYKQHLEVFMKSETPNLKPLIRNKCLHGLNNCFSFNFTVFQRVYFLLNKIENFA